MSGLINKVKEAVHSDKKDNHATDNPKSTNAGPHGSNMMNSADPRVDSDRDNLRTTGTTGGLGGHGTTGTTGAGYGSTGHSNAGPHQSNMMNSADPRVDSDRDGRGFGQGHAGTTGTGMTGGAGYGSTGTSGIGSHGSSGIGSTGTHGTSGMGNTGPHSSNMANRVDPRVDSDRDGRGFGQGHAGTTGTGMTGGAGYGSTGTSGIGSHGSSGIGSTGTHGAHGTHGTTGTTGMGTTGGYGGPGNPQSGNAGPHGSNMANKADPRIDSDMDAGRSGFGTSGVGHSDHTGYNQGASGIGSTGTHGSSVTPGSGNTSKTAGPHNSDMMNKLDPRVDSDMDGSKTMGGNATHR